MQRKGSYAACFASYAIWGLSPLYWDLMSGFSPYFKLAVRIFFTAVFMGILLVINKQTKDAIDVIKNRQTMKILVPGAFILVFTWGLYIWSVEYSHVMEYSMGIYISPIIVSALGIFFLKEKMSRLQVIALGCAVVGVVIYAVQYGSFPWIALIIAVPSAVYAIMKKKTPVNSVVATGIEATIMTPFALLYLALFGGGATGFAHITSIVPALLVVGTGVISGLPQMLYAKGMNELPLVTMGFMQYLNPSLALVSGVILGEPFSMDKVLGFVFIWMGLLVFVADMIVAERKHHHAKAAVRAVTH